MDNHFSRVSLTLLCLVIWSTWCDAGTACQEGANANPMPGQFIPSCEPNGSYSKEQCHASSGHCWCVDTQTGDEIDGTRTDATTNNADCNALCRHKASQSTGLLGEMVPQCEEDGMFKKQQCHGSTGHCWCVDPYSGTEINGTRSEPGEDKVSCDVLSTSGCRGLLPNLPWLAAATLLFSFIIRL